jgi:spore maturation protein CgeB
MKLMRVLLVCEYWYGTGGWSYRKYLEQLGCAVDIFDYRRVFFSAGASLPVVSAITRRINRQRMNRAFVQTVAKLAPDAVFFLKGETIYASAIRRARERYNPVLVQWYPDGPFNVEVKNATRDSIASIPLFDIYYIYARSLIAPLQIAGARRVEYLPFCYDPDMLRPPATISEEDRLKYATDVVFAGTWEPMREWWLEQLTGIGLSIWGNSWEMAKADSPAMTSWKGKAVYGEEISKLFAVSKIHLNFLREQNKDSNNVRTFEIPGFGGFLLTQRSREQAEELYVEGKEIVCFDTVDELIDKARYYLLHEDERLAIAGRGHARAVQEHQAIHRLRRVVDDITALRS